MTTRTCLFASSGRAELYNRFYQTVRARDSWPGWEARKLARAARVAGQDGVTNGLGRRRRRRLAVGRRLVYLPEEATRGLS